MKKAQLMGQPFVYIFYLVVFFLIIFFGIKTVGYIWDIGSDVDYAKFVNNLDNKINTIYNDAYGSRMDVSLRTPQEAIEICFIGDFSNTSMVSDVKLRLLLDTYYLQGLDINENVFFVGTQFSEELRAEYFEYLEVPVNFCDDLLDYNVDFTLEAGSQKVIITQPI